MVGIGPLRGVDEYFRVGAFRRCWRVIVKFNLHQLLERHFVKVRLLFCTTKKGHREKKYGEKEFHYVAIGEQILILKGFCVTHFAESQRRFLR